MSTVNSPNMNLPVPVVGNEAGPQYAIDINACMAQIDAHDHTSGQGVQITPSALNINADLTFNSMNAVGLRSSRYVSQGSPISGTSDLNCISVSGVDLYYRDGNGNIVRITQSGGVAGSPGSIANLTSPASASYVAIDETFVWQSDANVAANMDFRTAILRNAGAGSFGLTLQAPTLSGDATMTLPQVPLATNFLTIASTGTIGAAIPIAQGITTSMIADQNITTAKIADANVTLAKMAANSVDTAQIIDAAVTPAKMAPYNIALSSDTGSFLLTGTLALTGVQNATLVTSGRPVFVNLISSNNGSPAALNIIDPTNVPIGKLFLQRNGATISEVEISTSVVGATLEIPPAMSVIDTPSAGNYNYTLLAQISSPTTAFRILNIKIQVYEL